MPEDVVINCSRCVARRAAGRCWIPATWMSLAFLHLLGEGGTPRNHSCGAQPAGVAGQGRPSQGAYHGVRSPRLAVAETFSRQGHPRVVFISHTIWTAQ